MFCVLWQRAAGSENPEESSGALLEKLCAPKVLKEQCEKRFVEKIYFLYLWTMKPTQIIIASSALILFFSACKKDKDENVVGAPLIVSGIYPLAVGNEWKYYREFNFIDDSTLTDSLIASDYVKMRVDRNETLTNGDVTFAIEYEDSTNATITNTGTSFYYINSTGLYNPAYIFGSGFQVYLSQPAPILFKVGEMEFHSPADMFNTLTNGTTRAIDSIIFDTPPRWTIKNPLVLNELWTYITYPWLIKKKYVGDETISTAFGNVSCKKIEWLYDLNNDGTWDDIHVWQYISPTKGMLKETFNAWGVWTYSNGDTLGIGTFVDESIAISINF